MGKEGFFRPSEGWSEGLILWVDLTLPIRRRCGEKLERVKIQSTGSGADSLRSHPSSATEPLCDLEQVAQPLWCLGMPLHKAERRVALED